MSYRVEYASSGIKRKQIRQRRNKALLLTAVCFLIFLLIAGGFWPRGAQALREILLPGDGGRMGGTDPGAACRSAGGQRGRELLPGDFCECGTLSGLTFPPA